MKKTIFSIMFAMILGSFVACNGNAAQTAEEAKADSTLVDSTAIVADTLVCDSLVMIADTTVTE